MAQTPERHAVPGYKPICALILPLLQPTPVPESRSSLNHLRNPRETVGTPRTKPKAFSETNFHPIDPVAPCRILPARRCSEGRQAAPGKDRSGASRGAGPGRGEPVTPARRPQHLTASGRPAVETPPAPAGTPAPQGAAGTALRSAPHRAEPRSAPHCPALGSLPAAAGGRPRGAAAGPGRAAGAAAASPASPALRIPSSAARSHCPERGSPTRGSPAPSPRPSPLFPPEPPRAGAAAPAAAHLLPLGGGRPRRGAAARPALSSRLGFPLRGHPWPSPAAGAAGPRAAPRAQGRPAGSARLLPPSQAGGQGEREGGGGGEERKARRRGGGCPSRSRPPQVGSERPAAPGEPLREAESRGVSPSRTGGSLPPPSWSELPPPLGCSARLHASAAHPQPTAASPGFSRSPHPSRAGDGTARLDEAAGRGGGGGRLPLGQRSRTERPDGQTSREAPLLSRPLIPAAGESRGAVPALTDTCTLGGFLLRSLLQRKWRNPASPVPSFLPSASAFLAGSSILHRSPTSSLPQIPCTVSIPSSRLRPAHPGIIRCPASRTGVLHHLISACLLHVSLHSLPCEAHLI